MPKSLPTTDSRLASVRKRWTSFFLAPTSPVPLAVLRMGLAAVLLLQVIFLLPHFGDLYGSRGILQGALSVTGHVQGWNTGGWVGFWNRLGISETAALTLLGGGYTAALVLLFVGWKTRSAAIAAWFLHFILIHEQSTIYGLDLFAHMSLFLLIWSPCGKALSLDAGPGRYPGEPSASARLSLRVFQIYLCIAYLASGLEKTLGHQWWTGEAIWRSLMLPSLAQFPMEWLADHPWIPLLAGWGTLMVEIGYPVMIWHKSTRPLWLALTVSLHVGIMVFLGLWLFGLIMIVLNVAAFAVPHWLREGSSIRWPKRFRTPAPAVVRT